MAIISPPALPGLAGAEAGLRALLLALAVLAGAMVVVYLVAFDQGALSGSGMYLHELMHDGRHLLGVPCH